MSSMSLLTTSAVGAGAFGASRIISKNQIKAQEKIVDSRFNAVRKALDDLNKDFSKKFPNETNANRGDSLDTYVQKVHDLTNFIAQMEAAVQSAKNASKEVNVLTEEYQGYMKQWKLTRIISWLFDLIGIK